MAFGFFWSIVFEDGEDCSREGCCSGWYSLPIFDLYHEEEPKDDLNEEYQDGNCGAESFDIQPMMTTQGDEIAYFKVVENYEEQATHVPNDDQSLIERFKCLSLDDDDDDTFFLF